MIPTLTVRHDMMMFGESENVILLMRRWHEQATCYVIRWWWWALLMLVKILVMIKMVTVWYDMMFGERENVECNLFHLLSSTFPPSPLRSLNTFNINMLPILKMARVMVIQNNSDGDLPLKQSPHPLPRTCSPCRTPPSWPLPSPPPPGGDPSPPPTSPTSHLWSSMIKRKWKKRDWRKRMWRKKKWKNSLISASSLSPWILLFSASHCSNSSSSLLSLSSSFFSLSSLLPFFVVDFLLDDPPLYFLPPPAMEENFCICALCRFQYLCFFASCICFFGSFLYFSKQFPNICF